MKGGKSLNDRKLAAEVRTLGLKKIRAILLDEVNEKYSKDLQNQLILRLAGTLLPRLNEHTGEDGEPLQVIIPQAVATRFDIKNNGNTDTITPETGGSDTKSETI